MKKIILSLSVLIITSVVSGTICAQLNNTPLPAKVNPSAHWTFSDIAAGKGETKDAAFDQALYIHINAMIKKECEVPFFWTLAGKRTETFAYDTKEKVWNCKIFWEGGVFWHMTVLERAAEWDPTFSWYPGMPLPSDDFMSLLFINSGPFGYDVSNGTSKKYPLVFCRAGLLRPVTYGMRDAVFDLFKKYKIVPVSYYGLGQSKDLNEADKIAYEFCEEQAQKLASEKDASIAAKTFADVEVLLPEDYPNKCKKSWEFSNYSLPIIALGMGNFNDLVLQAPFKAEEFYWKYLSTKVYVRVKVMKHLLITVRGQAQAPIPKVGTTGQNSF